MKYTLLICRREGKPTVQKKILVVDDSDDTRDMMAKLLELEAFNVVTAEDGRAGLSAAEMEQPDLIITDINMPNLNGIEMIKRIREEGGLGEVPIIVMSAYGRRMIDDALEAGADGFVEKPIDFDKFLTAIRSKLPAA